MSKIEVNEHEIEELRHSFKCQRCKETCAYPENFEEFACNPPGYELEKRQPMGYNYDGYHPPMVYDLRNLDEESDYSGDPSDAFSS